MLLSILDASTHFYISLKIKVCHRMMTVTMETSNGNISKSGVAEVCDMRHPLSIRGRFLRTSSDAHQ